MTALHLKTLSHSELQTFRRCQREHLYTYRLRRRPRRAEEALRFGTLMHRGLNAWWQSGGNIERALAAIESEDAFDAAKARALMLGYHARWGGEPIAAVLIDGRPAVEAEFTTPIVNPESGRPSKTFALKGVLDVLARDAATGDIVIVEHKTTSEDIESTSDYWRRVTALDPQVSTYFVGAMALGMQAKRCVYDVIRKPSLKPYKATPVEDRKYTQPKTKACPECKKREPKGCAECVDGQIVTDPGGRLYANQREADETPDEFFERLCADIAEKPERYYARGDLVRLAEDAAEHASDVWHTARIVRESELEKRAPRNPDACRRYGRFCAYFGVCSGDASIDDDEKFETQVRDVKTVQEV